MKFRSKTTEAVALAFFCMAVDFACGVAFRLLDGRWPSLGFWLSGVVVYLVVVVPTLRRSRTKAGDGTPT
jgi:hypothetical protein